MGRELLTYLGCVCCGCRGEMQDLSMCHWEPGARFLSQVQSTGLSVSALCCCCLWLGCSQNSYAGIGRRRLTYGSSGALSGVIHEESVGTGAFCDLNSHTEFLELRLQRGKIRNKFR